MAFIVKFLISSVFIAMAYSRSFSLENIFERIQDTNCSCDWRYFKHYEAKGCLVEVTDSCGCPQKFSCPFNQTPETSAKACVHQNKEYKVGSKIITSDVCQVCKCYEGVPPYISCRTRECPEIEDTWGKDCHLVYKENKCCPVGVECFENETQITNNKTCEYNGRFYPHGSKIYPVDDPCQTCICDVNWSGVDNSSCYQQECIFEKHKSKLDEGCIPVYHESRCCPIEFYCPSTQNFTYSFPSPSNESSVSYNISYDNQCIFAGQSYALGEELFIDNSCVKCSCVVPPDFTCIHQTCPPSPSKENCFATYSSGECCPAYECMLGDADLVPAGCPTPICEDSTCRIEIPPGHECPTCVCGENSELEHNNLEQVQQINQNIEQFEHIQQVSEPREVSNDYSEDELQMMPIRMQDSEGHSSVLEKMVLLPEFDDNEQYSESFGELEKSSFENESNTEAASTIILRAKPVAEENSTFQTELDLNNYNESVANHSEKVVQKRSDVSDAANNDQTQVISAEQGMQEFNGDIEREGGDSEGNDGYFDELESFKNKIFDKNKTIINEIISINHVVKVPPGCPTPMCEGPWCKIGIPSGEKCPTCICKRHIGSEP